MKTRGQMTGNLARDCTEIEARWDGTFHLRVVGLSTSFAFAHRERNVLPTASAAKLCILCELFRQAKTESLALDEQVTWTEASFRGGDGVLKVMHPGQSLSLYRACPTGA